MTPQPEKEDAKTVARLKSLYEISRVLNASPDLKEAYPEMLQILSQKMRMKRGAVLLMNAESGEWEMGGSHGLSGEELKKRKEYFGSGVLERILGKGAMAAVTDEGEAIWVLENRPRAVPKRGAVSFLCAPVKNSGGISAIVGVDHLYEDSVPITEDFGVLGEMCFLISDAMMMRKTVASENRALLEENWGFRKELETLGRSVPKVTRRISLTEILEDRLSRMIAEMKVDPRSNGRLYDDVLNVVERTLLKSALAKNKHVQLKTARFLGINRNTLRRKIKELGITGKEK
jgi:transcriptional regulator with GAF, ATPase, and Fis domain